MLDIESLGTAPGSAILSISAVKFADDGSLGKEFDVSIYLDSCIEAGLKIDASTIIWWMRQSSEARDILTDDRVRCDIRIALEGFSNWYHKNMKEGNKIFAKDPDFDCSLLEEAYRKLRLHCPFNYRSKIAVRTLSALRPEFEKNEEFTGTKHNGIDDCKHQIKYVSKIIQDLKN